MSDVSNRARQPKGVPIGGEFKSNEHSEAPRGLIAGLNEKEMTQRARALIFGKHVKALDTYQMPEDPDQWWDRQYMQGEYEGEGSTQSYPKMPDDNTPSALAGRDIGGRSMSGKLRTYRRRYEGENGIGVRMPSKAAINRYADQLGEGGTFDVPVTATRPDGTTVSGWVRVTKTSQSTDGSSTWETSPVGFRHEQDAVMVPEVVNAVLESRSARSSLRGIQSFAQRRREREAVRGTRLMPVTSSTFITGVAYDPQSQVAAVRIGEKTYGYAGVTPDRFFRVVNDVSIGRAYGRELKNNPEIAASFQIPTCGECGNMYPAGATHRCPKKDRHSSRTQGADLDFTQTARAHAAERINRS